MKRVTSAFHKLVKLQKMMRETLIIHGKSTKSILLRKFNKNTKFQEDLPMEIVEILKSQN